MQEVQQSAFNSCIIRKIGMNRGKRRVYLQGTLPNRSGFAPGTTFRFASDKENLTVALIRDPQGARIVSGKNISDDHRVPVIDIESNELLSMFDGMEQIRVIFTEDAICLMPLASERKAQERRDRLTTVLAANDPIKVGSLSHGGGILSHALHHGLHQAGVKSELVFANDIREDCLVHAAEHNDVWSPKTKLLAMPMQELAQDDGIMSRLGKIELLEAGLPCNAASVAARAKKKDQQSMPEEDPDVGHLAMAFIQIIARLQPVIITLENVVPYRSTASMAMIRTQLKDMGYVVHETQVNGRDWNCLEARERMIMVAVTKGVAFDLSALTPPVREELRVADILDDIGSEDPRWSSFDYLVEKEARDKAAGKGFQMQRVYPSDDRIPTLRKFYHKGGSTDPYLAHPANPALMRKFTVAEHARAKSIPDHLIADTSQTFGHEVLGQSINYNPFRGLGAMMGSQVRHPETVKVLRDESLSAPVNAEQMSQPAQLDLLAA